MSYQAFYSNLKPRKKSKSRIDTAKQPERLLGLNKESIIQHEKDPNVDDIIWCSEKLNDIWWIDSGKIVWPVPIRMILLLGMASSAGFFLNSGMFPQSICHYGIPLTRCCASLIFRLSPERSASAKMAVFSMVEREHELCDATNDLSICSIFSSRLSIADVSLSGSMIKILFMLDHGLSSSLMVSMHGEAKNVNIGLVLLSWRYRNLYPLHKMPVFC